VIATGADYSGQEMPQEDNRLIPVKFVGDTNCLASVMAMAINTLSWVGKRYPFTGYGVKLYLHKTWYTELFRGLALLAKHQHVTDVGAEQKYILDTDPPLDVVVMQELECGHLVQLFVSGNAWLRYVRQEEPEEKDEGHTILVNGYVKKQGELFFVVQDPDGGQVEVRFDMIRPALTRAYPDSSFLIEDINDLKLYDRIVIWKNLDGR